MAREVQEFEIIELGTRVTETLEQEQVPVEVLQLLGDFAVEAA